MGTTLSSIARPRNSQNTKTAAAIGAVLFDVDGVIADTARLHTAAWARLAVEEYLPFDEQCAEALRGLSREASLRRLLGDRQVPEESFAAMADRKNAYYTEALAGIGPSDMLPGAAALIAGFAELGIRRAAVSLSCNARAVLARLGVADRFDVIVDGHATLQTNRGAVDRYGHAAAALRVEPRRCLVIEDSASGITLARSAGMKTVGVGSPQRLCAADLVFESLRGVRARDLLRWLGGPVVCCRQAPPVV